MNFLERTRDGYDATAPQYAELFHHHLDDKPVEQAMLAAFAAMVRGTGNDTVADVGCGTGATTAILRDLGVSPTGIDLSPNMIAQARRRNPDLDFSVGSMTDLDVPDASAGGVCAWYSTIHVPDSHLPTAFAEFRRVLAPMGVVLLAFQVGDETRHLSEAFGIPVDLHFHRRHTGDIEAALATAGMRVQVRTVREADAEADAVESLPQAFVIARKC